MEEIIDAMMECSTFFKLVDIAWKQLWEGYRITFWRKNYTK
jgi:hypothetical protein